MALVAGDAVVGTGLAGAIADKLEEKFGIAEYRRVLSSKAVNAIAEAVVEYVTANAEVTVPNGTTGGDTLSGTVG